ncbi:TPA: hypothetical protein MW178_003384 [Acinetobacter baumannii]|nr:hypothetical protein [Acinetobacter baumannii]
MLKGNTTKHIVFIDEQKSEHHKFQRLFMQEIYTSEVNITPLFPCKTLEEMIELIISFHPDALVVDWNLNDIKTEGVTHNVRYSGSDLVKEFLSIRKNFPCFIATSLDEDASKSPSTFDINMIYPKSSSLDETTTTEKILTFKDRVLLQIKKYKTLINEKENRFETLSKLKHSGKNLTYEEEKEFKELDSFLEAAIDDRAKTPEDLKEITNTQRLDSLLKGVNDLLSRISKYDS